MLSLAVSEVCAQIADIAYPAYLDEVVNEYFEPAQAATRIDAEEHKRQTFLATLSSATGTVTADPDPVLHAITQTAGDTSAQGLLGALIVYARELHADRAQYTLDDLAAAARMSSMEVIACQQAANLPNVVYALNSGARKRGVRPDPHWSLVLRELECEAFPDGAPPF